MRPALILASASPRRSLLLQQIGVPHRCVAGDIQERRGAGEPAAACVLRLAAAKALTVRERCRGETALPVLGADTAVLLDDELLGKPRDRDEGLLMLERLSGRWHTVLSAVALAPAAQEGPPRSRLCRSEVLFRALSALERAAYWDSGEPHGKAGAYAIQGQAAVFIEQLRGSYSGVMGLPLFETAQLLAEIGLPAWCGSCRGRL